MTHLSNGTVVTNIDAPENAALVAEGYTVRHIEDWHGHGSCIVWDAPEISETDLPY